LKQKTNIYPPKFITATTSFMKAKRVDHIHNLLLLWFQGKHLLYQAMPHFGFRPRKCVRPNKKNYLLRSDLMSSP